MKDNPTFQEKRKEYSARNCVAIRAKQAEYRATNVEVIRQRQTQYKENNREKLNKVEADMRMSNKLKLIAYFGGCCAVCKYDKYHGALEFHHHAKKNFDISKKFSIRLEASWQKVLKEAKLCVLLCANCHREFHAGKIALPDITVDVS
jgi:predicted HNH restriction endonuclease